MQRSLRISLFSLWTTMRDEGRSWYDTAQTTDLVGIRIARNLVPFSPKMHGEINQFVDHEKQEAQPKYYKLGFDYKLARPFDDMLRCIEETVDLLNGSDLTG